MINSEFQKENQINNLTIELPWNLLDGETLVDAETRFSEILFVANNEKFKGKFYITNFRFYFKSDEPHKLLNDGKETNLNHLILDVPLGFIQRIEKIFNYNSNQINELMGILINCKNGRKLKFFKVSEDNNFERLVYEYLNKHAFPLSNNMAYFAFFHKPKFLHEDGWSIYDAEQEYARMGINESKKWRITKTNINYKLCETYPSVLVVPQTTSDKELELIAEFRSKSRIPVLSWIRYDDNSHGGAILRSSQPLCGMSGKRNQFDEIYLKYISETSPDKILFILDARPYINALANCTTGGGYENEKYYVSCKISFLNIENIHAVRDSLGANNDKDFFSNLQNSKWLEHIRLILEGALKIVNLVEANHNVLVHCSDGWDRTSQLTSLSMLMLDKYYRTIRGFQVLIEKEWLSFGHKFETRMGHGTDKYTDQDRSPIFLQFIDCVWQIMQQFKTFFEFNENFLLIIVQSMYTCQYGTFLMDSESERERKELKSKTPSLWSYVNSNVIEFYNSDYIAYDKPLKCSTAYLKLWTNYYFQHKDTSDINTTDTTLQKSFDTMGNLFENITPNSLSFLSNGFRLFNQIKSNLRN